jgi:hypothetical protein
VWWVGGAVQAIRIKAQCEAEETADVCSVAAALRITITSHAETIARAQAAVERIEDRLEGAKEAGILRAFNHKYRVLRLAARQHGEHFAPYHVCYDRLRKALYRAVSGDIDGDLINKALGCDAKGERT